MFQYSMLRFPLTSSGPRAARIALLLIGLAGLLFALAAPHAEARSAKRIELGGKNLQEYTPNCGKDFSRQCALEGKVTAYQSLSSQYPGRNFNVPFNGKLIAWSISLSNPTRVDIGDNGAQLPFFNEIFGAPSQAGVAILRQVEKRKKGAPKFKLVRRSPIQILNPYFGTKVTFTLDTPLNVYEGNVVALMIPTWAPALYKPRACNPFGDDVLNPIACNRAIKENTWRGSRVERGEPEKTCTLNNAPEPNEQLLKTRAQTGVDSIRRYGCYYGGNVLLYSATIVGRQ